MVRKASTYQHRAMRRMAFPAYIRWQMLWIPALFTLLGLPMQALVLNFWREIYQFWMSHLNLDAAILTETILVLGFRIDYPYLEIAGGLSPHDIWMVYLLSAIVMVAASFIVSDRWLPLRYLLRIAAIVWLVTVVFFLAVPESFPSDTTGHIKTLTLSCLVLMWVAPWVHSLIYYVFDFHAWQKIAFTTITLVFLAAFFPMLSLLHVYLLQHLSILLLPTLFFIFGLSLLIACMIGLYGWAMSWRIVGPN